MGIDMDDPLDDIFADDEPVKNARPVGKFQPKANKFRPAKKDPAPAPVSSSQALKTVNSAQTELNEPVSTAKPSENCSDVLPSVNGGEHTSTEKSAVENADLSIGLEALGDFPPHTSTNTECAVLPSEAVTVDVPNPESGAIPILSSVEDSTQTCKVADEPFIADEPIGSCSDGHDQMNDRQLGREDLDVMASINITELTTKPGQRMGKFQPKRKIQMHKEISEVSDTVSCSLGSQSVRDEINYAEKDSSPMFQQDDVLDLSSLGFTHTLPNEETELPLNEESINLMETSQLDSGNLVAEESLPKIPAKLVSRRAKTGRSKTYTAKDPSPEQQKASTLNQENETGRSLRPRKSKVSFCELVDEDDDENEVLANGDTDEAINNEEFQVENEPQKEKVKRKSGKMDDGKEKPTRKQKKAKESSDQEASVKPKKFSHSTRRRRVNKTLLETPEDEIDYQKVPLRDLILLAEHREREMKKEEEAAGAAAVKQSTGNSSGLYNDEGTSTSKQGGEYDEEESPMVEDTTVYFNYQTHMKKKPTKRWSKQDTEKFYEAVRQFGTDFRMIKKALFPDRKRKHLKLKYKKEERQHPQGLNDALTNRTKDLTQFETVIERLKQKAAEKYQNADTDDFMDLTGNEVADEGTLNVDDDEEKDEHIEVKESNDVATDPIEVQSSVKDDELLWSQYKSDT